VKKIIQKGALVSALAFLFTGIISCEKDFTDLTTTIVSNTEFNTKDTILEVVVTPVPITSVRADGLSLGGSLGQYLLGVYNNPNYKKIEASIVSQLARPVNFVVNDKVFASDTIVHTELDTVILRIPYQATSTKAAGDTKPKFKLDSIIGDINTPFTLNIYENSTYLNSLNPTNPSQGNTYQSDDVYVATGLELNAEVNYQFIPNENDTVFYVNRKLSTGVTFRDSIKLTNSAPFARIPLKKAKFQEFMNKYKNAEFDSQDAFNNYFRGIILKAEGNNGSLLSLSFNGDLAPSIEIYYTNTVKVSSTGEVLDTIKKNDSFLFSGVKNSIYKMTPNNVVPNNNIAIQGTAGTQADVAVFGTDTNGNGLPDQIDELRTKNWLINDASLTFYVNQNIVGSDTIATPFKLFLFKRNTINGSVTNSQIKDVTTEGLVTFGGKRELSSDKKPNKYTFRITDYVSDLLSGESNFAPVLGLKVINSTDLPSALNDTIIETYNWNPKVVMLLNHSLINGERRARLKISYTEKKN